MPHLASNEVVSLRHINELEDWNANIFVFRGLRSRTKMLVLKKIIDKCCARCVKN